MKPVWWTPHALGNLAAREIDPQVAQRGFAATKLVARALACCCGLQPAEIVAARDGFHG
jgi:hypothetical protein